MPPDEHVEGDRAGVAVVHLFIIHVPRQRQLPLWLVVLPAGPTEQDAHPDGVGRRALHPTQLRGALDHSSITDKRDPGGFERKGGLQGKVQGGLYTFFCGRAAGEVRGDIAACSVLETVAGQHTTRSGRG